MSRAREFADLAGSADAGGIGGSNMVINGAMQVAQRNSSSAVTITGDGVYNTVDRFKSRTFGGSGRFSMQQVTDTPNNSFTNSLKLVVTTTDTSGSAGYSIEHVVEDNAIAAAGFGDSDARPVTLSFWVKSSVTGSYSASLRANNSTGTPANVQEYSISSANTWEHKEITFPAYTSGLTLTHLLLDFGLGKQTSKTTSTLGTWQTTNFVFGSNQVDWQSNSGANFYLTGVQLELGEQATPFAHLSFGDELAKCQRYFQKSYDYGTAIGASTEIGAIFSRIGTAVSNQPIQVVFPVPMRGQPADTIYSLVGTAGSVSDCGTSYSHDHDEGASINGTVGQTGFSKMQGVSMTAGNMYAFHYTMDAEL